jgi:PAS domain-containing protein
MDSLIGKANLAEQRTDLAPLAGDSDVVCCSLTTRLLRLLVAVSAVLIVVAAAIGFTTNHAMSQLVRRTMVSNVDKVRTIVTAEAQNLSRNVADYAVWDEMVENIDNPDSAWYAENVTEWYPRAFDVDVILSIDPTGRIVYSYGGLPGFEPESQIVDRRLVDVSPARPHYEGLWQCAGNYYLLAVSGVFPSNSTVLGDNPHGVLIAGYKITPERIARLEDLTHETIALCDLAGDAPPLIAHPDDGPPSDVTAASGCCIWHQIDGTPGAFLKVTSSFPAVDKTIHLAHLGLVLLAAIWFGVVLLAFYTVRRWIVRPIAEMRSALRRFESGEIVDWWKLLRTGDELDALCRAFGTISTELRGSEQSMRAVVEGAADSVLLLNAAGEIQMANEKARHLFGSLIGSRVAVRLDALVAESHRDIFGLAWVELLTDGRFYGTFPLVSGDDSVVTSEISSIVLADGRVFVSLRDVTERERLRKDVSAAQSHAKHLEGLHQAAVTLQHEINNPLTAVLGNSELIRLRLELRKGDPTAAEIKDIHAAVKDISDLARRMRDVLSKLRSLYNPVVTLHPTGTEQGAQMINLKDSE